MYDIFSKSDFEAGATLVVTMPREDVDEKALYTILSDRPNFLLPFRHRAIDGKIEITYQIGNRSKITYLSGNKSSKDFIDLWSAVLKPLIDCWDWFLNPFSFVLVTDYLFYDKKSKTISYIYIPSVKAYSDHETLKNMVIEIERENKVTDVALQNDVLRALQDFKPGKFLDMLTSYKTSVGQVAAPLKASNPQQGQSTESQQHPPLSPMQSPVAVQVATPQSKSSHHSSAPVQQPMFEQPGHGVGDGDNIVINFPPDGKKAKEKKAKKEKQKKEKPSKTKPPKVKSPLKEKIGIFGKKKQVQQDIVQGAAAMSNDQQQSLSQPQQPIYVPEIFDDSGETQIEVFDKDVPKFRYIGNKEHPIVVEVDINENEAFTIGRFDASVGTQQSNFEFDKKTKAVSRRHAAVERKEDGYYIVDLSSSAGTFLDGRKLPPNASFILNHNSRVSFGHSGADYIWEEC